MMTKESMLKILNESKQELINKYRVKKVGLFGSFVKNKQKIDSDIDVLVDFNEEADLFDLSGLALFLEQRFKRKVDVVSQDALRKELKRRILKEVIYL